MRIKAKLTLAFLAVALVPFSVASALAHYNVEEALTRDAVTHLETMASVQKSRVEAFVYRNYDRFRFVANNGTMRSALGRSGGDPAAIDPATVTRAFVEAMAADDAIETVSLLDRQNRVLVSTEQSFIGAVHPDVRFGFRQDIKPMEDLPSVVVTYPSDRKVPLVTTSGPLTGGRAGLAIRTHGQELAQVVKNDAAMGETGESFLATRDQGGDALFITPLRFDPTAALRRTIPKDDMWIPITRALKREEVTLTDARDYRGVPVLAATRYVPGPEWGLVVKLDKAEAFKTLNGLRLVLAPIFLVAALAAILASFYVSALITRPVIGLTRAARRIEEGHLDTRLGIPDHDEIGILARTLEQMADRLIEANSDLERKVRLRTEELARTNAELEQFAYIASHDLQEPLRIVTSYTGLLQRRYKDRLDSDADEFIGYAVDAASRMRQLINDLLAYSRVGRSDLSREPADTGFLAQEALANLQSAIEESGAIIEVGHLPEIACRRSQVVQLFQNLVGNAIKYRSAAPPRVSVSAERRGPDWEFTVSDNGIGIDPRYSERIFLIFQRLHGKGEYQGTGIGLAVCKKIVESHGGRIWVESQAGAGARFHFTLPGEPETSSTDAAENPPRQPTSALTAALHKRETSS